MGWVTRAMVTVLQISLNIDPWKAAILLFAITAGYTIFSGLWGVVVTDTFQFVVKMGGVIVLAVIAVKSVGGLDALVAQAAEAHFGSREAAFGVLPPTDKAWLPVSTLIVFLGGAVVGRLVSRRRARRRRLRGAAHPGGQGRAARPARHPVVQHRPLRAPPLALDPGRASWHSCDTPAWPIPKRATSG